MKFKLHSKFKPAGGQNETIKKLFSGYYKFSKQTLLGITGSGKTFVMANLIEKVQKPTLILAHNKTLAGQLYQEFKEFFPENRVEYFISYYDYYQPESYLPTSDTYIEKEATVNSEIERLRLKTMSALLSRNDVIVIASISCIYGAGNPKDYKELAYEFNLNEQIPRSKFISIFINMLYDRNDLALEKGRFRVRGDTIDIIPAYDENIIRFELFGNEIERILEINPISGEKISSLNKIKIFPAKQFIVPEEKQRNAISKIREELNLRKNELDLLESERLKKKVNYDIEMIEEMGYCNGIENYSRYFDGRKKGEAPFVLLDYFPKDFTLIIDESHQSIPQSHGMYKGDYARKKNLIDFGFRLPSAYDNRPLKFDEFEKYFNHTIFVSATPANYEIGSSGQIVEQIIRPTGLLDPKIEVKDSDGQIENLIKEIKLTIGQGDKILVTTLTKKMSEDLCEFFAKKQFRVRYLHSEIDSLDRIELIRQLRADEFDILIGINLLREGLDIPEVSLVAILDADKEGFLRNERSLIQTIGRAARNSNGRVIMYANKMTMSMRMAIEKTKFRRKKQIEYNKKHNITPKTISKNVNSQGKKIKGVKHLGKSEIERKIIDFDSEMKKAAENLDFEKAIEMRDLLEQMKKELEYK